MISLISDTVHLPCPGLQHFFLTIQLANACSYLRSCLKHHFLQEILLVPQNMFIILALKKFWISKPSIFQIREAQVVLKTLSTVTYRCFEYFVPFSAHNILWNRYCAHYSNIGKQISPGHTSGIPPLVYITQRHSHLLHITLSAVTDLSQHLTRAPKLSEEKQKKEYDNWNQKNRKHLKHFKALCI